MRRPKNCRFWTVHDVAAWISNNAPCSSQEPYNAAKWWKAVMDAESMRDMNGRELAEFCYDGMKPVSLRDVSQELQAPHLDQERVVEADRVPVEDIDKDVENSLRRHFGLPELG